MRKVVCFVSLAALALGGCLFRQENAWRGIPAEITRLLAEGQQLAVDPVVDAQLAGVAAEGQRAVANNDRSAAETQLEVLRATNQKLAQEYDLRIVSRRGEDTGFWRQSNDWPDVRHYYLVVEAVGLGGQVQHVPITSIETQQTESVSKWAKRVDKSTFDRIAAEKADGGGIITNTILGHKARGELEPRWKVSLPDGAITEW